METGKIEFGHSVLPGKEGIALEGGAGGNGGGGDEYCVRRQSDLSVEDIGIDMRVGESHRKKDLVKKEHKRWVWVSGCYRPG